MFSIEFSQTAEKQLFKLDKEIGKRVVSILERIKIRPYSYVKRLSGYPYFRLRIGDYRAILQIQENEKKIIVLEIGHRKNIYK
ncbi:MAG TPA: type II toxin-antitoxin system RelE/ParE family toxin [Candidatus Nanoarchaeia archaeon]|nr:type II toxin-antitoxin system RelE/ParE family toxin [Candidatus Nanoarchaeia archaeon]